MWLYVLLTAIVVLLGVMVNSNFREQIHSRGQMLNRVILIAVFLLLFAVSACRIAVGNDYWVYRYQFLMIAQERHVSYEIGFQTVVYLMQLLFGYDNYLPIFALFSGLTACFFVKAMYDNSDWFAGTIFLLMTGGYYFMSFDNVRYYFALSVAMYAMKHALKRKYWKFILWICFAACFHKTVLIVIPIYLVAQIVWTKKNLWLIPTAAVVLLFGKEVLKFIIFKFYPYYEGSVFENTDVSYANIAKCGAVLIFALIYFKEIVRKNRYLYFFFNLNLGAFLLYCFAPYIPEISRICYYMLVGQIFLIPGIIIRIEKKWQKILWSVLIGLAFAGYFYIFLRKSYATEIRLLPYLNWIFN